jgi:hypothetical protein
MPLNTDNLFKKKLKKNYLLYKKNLWNSNQNISKAYLW